MTFMRQTLVAVAAAFTLGAAPAHAASAPAVLGKVLAAKTVKVTMTDDKRFSPDSVEIQKGDTVEWENTSAIMHTVTADPGKAKKKSDVELPEGAKPFDSGNLQPGKTYSHTFETTGTYRYVCLPHELQGMVGTVRVKSSGGTHKGS